MASSDDNIPINCFFFLEKWALCYRHFDHCDTDTNMLVERYVHGRKSIKPTKYHNSYTINSITLVYSFHNKLKSSERYFDHKVNRRVDDLMNVLLKIESDMYIAQKTKEVGQCTCACSYYCL